MILDIKHELKNFLISFVAVVLIVGIFEVALSTGILYQLARITDKIHIFLGFMPRNMLPKLVGGYAYSIVSVNMAVFIILSLGIGYLAFRMISKRSTVCLGLIYGIFMAIIFYIIGSILVTLSEDPFNWLAVMFGAPITLVIQSLLATYILKDRP